MVARTLGVWVLAARPKTLWAAVAPVIIGSAIAYEAGVGHWPSAIAALFGAVLLQTGANFANDYYDCAKGADHPGRLGPTRVTQAGLVSPRQMRKAMAVVFGLATLAGVYLVWRGGWPILAIGLLSILCGLLYTAGPFPLGYHGLGDLFVLMFFGPVATGGTYYVQALHIDVTAIGAGLAPGLFSVAILTVNNLRDLDSDRRIGKKTLAVRFGRTYARIQYVLAVVVASLLPLGFHIVTGRHRYVVLASAVVVLALPSLKTVLRNTAGPHLNDTLAATGKLLLLYSILFSVGWLL